jgi:hypothetical protein
MADATRVDIRPIEARDKAALAGAVQQSSDSVGVARYVRDDERPDSAEIAVSVLGSPQVLSSAAGTVELAVDV